MGVTLELSIHSPSDRCHQFKHYQFDSDAIRHPVYNDPAHGFVEGGTSTPSMNSIMRLYGSNPIDIGSASIQPLPTVDHITKLVIRRLNRRRLAPQGLARILRALPNLHTLHVETWREWTQWQCQLADVGKIYTSIRCHRRILRKVATANTSQALR